MKYFLVLLLILSVSGTQAKTSQEQRAELDYEFAFHTGQDYGLYVNQLSFSRYIDDVSWIGVKVGSGSESDRVQTNVSIQYKFFTGNTFYISPEIYYVNFDERDKYSFLTADRLTSIGAHFRIGNQWQWNHMSVGCDWIGLGKSFAYFHREGEDTLSEYSATFLNLYVGWSW